MMKIFRRPMKCRCVFVNFNKDKSVPRNSLHITCELNKYVHSCNQNDASFCTIWCEFSAIRNHLYAPFKFSFQSPERSLLIKLLMVDLVPAPRTGVYWSKPHDKALWASKLNKWSCGGCEALYWWDCCAYLFHEYVEDSRNAAAQVV